MEPSECAVSPSDFLADPLSLSVWKDFTLDTIRTSDWYVSVLIESVVKVHILDMRSATAYEPVWPLREMPVEFDIPTLNILQSQAIEPQAIYYELIPNRPRPTFVAASSMARKHTAARASAVIEFLDPLARELQEAPEETWRDKAIAQLGSVQPKSPWADAIGLLYSAAGMAAALGIPQSYLQEATDQGIVLALETTEGGLLYPAAQVRRDGKVVRGLQWILGQLDDVAVDHYTLAAWLNQRHEDLDDSSVWDILRGSEELPKSVRDLVGEFRASASR